MASLPEHLSFKTWTEQRSLNKAAAALETMPLDEVAAALDGVFEPVLEEGETMPDWRFEFTLTRRLIKRRASNAVGFDQDRRSSVKKRQASVEKRGRSALNLRRDLWALAVKVENHYGRGVLRMLGLAGKRPSNPAFVYDLAVLVRKNLRSDWFEFPQPVDGRGPLNRFLLADELDPMIEQVEGDMSLTEERFESADAALGQKHEAQDEATVGRRTLVSRLHDLLVLAGRGDLAERLRLRQPRSTAEIPGIVAGDDPPPDDPPPDDPPSGEPAPGDPPSGEPAPGDPPSGEPAPG